MTVVNRGNDLDYFIYDPDGNLVELMGNVELETASKGLACDYGHTRIDPALATKCFLEGAGTLCVMSVPDAGDAATGLSPDHDWNAIWTNACQRLHASDGSAAD
jgi:hypothetical protein